MAFAPPQGAPLSFADIFQQVAPAVVQIDVKTRVQRPAAIQIPGFGTVPIPGQPRGGGSGEGRGGGVVMAEELSTRAVERQGESGAPRLRRWSATA